MITKCDFIFRDSYFWEKYVFDARFLISERRLSSDIFGLYKSKGYIQFCIQNEWEMRKISK